MSATPAGLARPILDLEELTAAEGAAIRVAEPVLEAPADRLTLVRTPAEVDWLIALVTESAAITHRTLAAVAGEPLEVLRRIKFEPLGVHPLHRHPLNLIEQVNQTGPIWLPWRVPGSCSNSIPTPAASGSRRAHTPSSRSTS